MVVQGFLRLVTVRLDIWTGSYFDPLQIGEHDVDDVVACRSRSKGQKPTLALVLYSYILVRVLGYMLKVETNFLSSLGKPGSEATGSGLK